MRYWDIVRRAFAGMKSGALWSFAVGTTVARISVMLVVLAGAFFAFGPSGLERIWGSALPASLVSQMGEATYFFAVSIASVVAIPITLIATGGLVDLTDGVLAGRPVVASEGWSAGVRWIGRVFAITLIVGVLMFVLVLITLIPLVLAIAGVAVSSAGGSGPSGLKIAAAIGGICCGYLFFFALLILATMFVSALQSIATRYAIIGRRTAGDAVSAAWKAIRARWKNVIVFSLILAGFSAVFVVIMMMVLVPLQLLTGAASFAAPRATKTFGELVRNSMITTPITAVLALPFAIFISLAWTAFFRQMTGLDAPTPAESMYAAPSDGYAPVEATVQPELRPSDDPPMAPAEPPAGADLAP